MSKKLQSLQDGKTAVSEKPWTSWPKRNELPRTEAERVHAEMEDNGQKVQAESLAEAELDLEIRKLQSGEVKQGQQCNTEQCPAFLHNFFTPGADLARQKLVLLQN